MADEAKIVQRVIVQYAPTDGRNRNARAVFLEFEDGERVSIAPRSVHSEISAMDHDTTTLVFYAATDWEEAPE